MAGAADIRAGRAFVELYVENSKVAKGLTAVGKELSAFGAGVTTIGKRFAILGAAVVAPMIAAAKSWADSGTELYRLSQKTGMTAENLSALEHAADETGGSAEGLTGAVRKMNKCLADAMQGSKSGTEALTQLGLSIANVMNLSPDEQFALLAERISQVKNPALQSAAAQELFGRGALELLPLLKQGAAGIEKYRKEAQELGYIKTTESVKAAFELHHAMERIGAGLRIVWGAVASALAPMLTGIGNWFSLVARKAQLWVGENKPLIVTIFGVGVAVLGLGGGLLVLGKTISLTGALFSGAATLIGAFGHVLGVAVAALGFIVSPIGLVVAGLAWLAAWFLYASGTAGKAMDWLVGTFKDLLASAQDTFGAIADALSAGDIGAAMKIAGALLKLEWMKVCNFFSSTWEAFKGLYDEAVTGLSIGMVNASATIQSVWADLLNWMAKKWQEFGTSAFTETLAGWIAPIFAQIEGVSVEDAQKALTEDFAAARKSQPGKLAAMDAETAAKKRQIEAERNAQIEILGGDLANRDKGRAAKEKASQDDVDAARAALVDAQKEARVVGARHRAEMEKEQKPAIEPGDLAGMIGGAKISGTFSGAVATQMGGAGGWQLLARKMDRFIFVGETTTRHLADIKDRL